MIVNLRRRNNQAGPCLLDLAADGRIEVDQPDIAASSPGQLLVIHVAKFRPSQLFASFGERLRIFSPPGAWVWLDWSEDDLSVVHGQVHQSPTRMPISDMSGFGMITPDEFPIFRTDVRIAVPPGFRCQWSDRGEESQTSPRLTTSASRRRGCRTRARRAHPRRPQRSRPACFAPAFPMRSLRQAASTTLPPFDRHVDLISGLSANLVRDRASG